MCRKLLSQPYIAPVLSALLYQWMLTHKGAGGAEQQRQKHVNLLVAGAGPAHEHADCNRLHAGWLQEGETFAC